MRRPVATGVLVVALCISIVGGMAMVSPAAGADNPALLNFEPREIDAEPGESVEVDIQLQAAPSYDDDGVVWFEYTVGYDEDILTATDVTIGPWMDQEEPTDVTTETDIDEAAGNVMVYQERDPPAGGVSDTGETSTATITFEAADDAPAADAILVFTDAEAHMLEYPLPVLTTRDATVAIDGGGEERSPIDDRRQDGNPSVTLADDQLPANEVSTWDEHLDSRALAIAGVLTSFVVGASVLLSLRRT